MAAESMIERVAKMLAGLRSSGVVLFGVPVEEKHRMMARAAIMAMREPTKEMKSEGFNASPHDVGGCRDQIESDEEWMQEAVINVWGAMIDAALKDET